jgi:hypothetical protein
MVLHQLFSINQLKIEIARDLPHLFPGFSLLKSVTKKNENEKPKSKI